MNIRLIRRYNISVNYLIKKAGDAVALCRDNHPPLQVWNFSNI